MTGGPADHASVRLASPGDATGAASLLRRFNTEYGDPAPEEAALAERLRSLMASGETSVLLAGDGPDGVAVVRFRPALFTSGLECYLAELYVVPERRGRGLGRALLERAVALARVRGADRMDLGTSESDTVARHLYEGLGFVNREHGPSGPVMFVYERDL